MLRRTAETVRLFYVPRQAASYQSTAVSISAKTNEFEDEVFLQIVDLHLVKE
jgi:hypothetical protein